MVMVMMMVMRDGRCHSGQLRLPNVDGRRRIKAHTGQQYQKKHRSLSHNRNYLNDPSHRFGPCGVETGTRDPGERPEVAKLFEAG